MSFELTQQQIEQIEYEVSKQPEHVQEHYRMMVENGQSPRFALMCAMKAPPGTRYTDKTFNKARREIMGNMKPKMRKAYLEMAAKAGISTQGKFYVGGLGRPTDPAAWVSTIDDVKDVCKARNLTASGLVSHQGHEGTYKRKKLAGDIKRRLVRQRLGADPALAAKCAKDRRELLRVEAEVVDRHAKRGTASAP